MDLKAVVLNLLGDGRQQLQTEEINENFRNPSGLAECSPVASILNISKIT